MQGTIMPICWQPSYASTWTIATMRCCQWSKTRCWFQKILLIQHQRRHVQTTSHRIICNWRCSTSWGLFKMIWKTLGPPHPHRIQPFLHMAELLDAISQKRPQMMHPYRVVPRTSTAGPMAAVITLLQIAHARQMGIRRTLLLFHVKGVKMLFAPQSNDGGRRVLTK